MQEYLVEQKKLANTCQFGSSTDYKGCIIYGSSLVDTLKVRYVCGLKCQKTSIISISWFEPVYYCCGENGHRNPDCKFKTFTSNLCDEKVTLKMFVKLKPAKRAL